MRKSLFVLLLAGVLVSVLCLVFLYQRMTDISRPFPKVEEPFNNRADLQKPLYYIGVVSRFSPTLIYRGYQPVMDYLSHHSPYRFELKLSKSYKQTIEQLVSGKVVAAFLGSFIFAKEKQKFHLRCILRPLSKQKKPELQAVVVCKTQAPLHSIRDLKGKKVALPSGMSFASNWFLYQALPENGLHRTQLDSIHCYAHHQTVIYEVLKGNFEAGVVKDRVAYAFQDQGIRILERSEPIPSSPLAVSEKSPPVVVQAISKALLQINLQKERYENLLSSWDKEFIYGFAPAENTDYDVLQPLINAAESNHAFCD